MNEMVIHCPKDLFNKPKDAALAYYLCSGNKRAASTAYVWANSDNSKYFFDIKEPVPQTLDGVAFVPRGAVYSDESQISEQVLKIGSIWYIYFIEAGTKKLVEVSLKMLGKAKEQLESAIKQTLDNLGKEVLFLVSHFTDYARKTSLLLGFVAGAMQISLKTAITTVEVTLLTLDLLSTFMQNKNTISAYMHNTENTLAEKIEGLIIFAEYEDSYYLGKILADIVMGLIGVFGIMAGVEAFFAGMTGSFASIVAAPVTAGVSVAVLVPSLTVALSGAAVTVASVSVVYASISNVGSDFGKLKESKGKDSQDKASIIKENIIKNDPKWKSQNNLENHVRKRIKKGHISENSTASSYNNKIKDVLKSDKLEVYEYKMNEITGEPFDQIYYIYGDGEWIVMVGENGILETAFPPDLINGGYKGYLEILKAIRIK